MRNEYLQEALESLEALLEDETVSLSDQEVHLLNSIVSDLESLKTEDGEEDFAGEDEDGESEE